MLINLIGLSRRRSVVKPTSSLPNVGKRGKREHENQVQSQLAYKYAAGELKQELLQAEAAYTRGMTGAHKHAGIAMLLKPPESS